jgi:hypothetical protein
MKKKEQKVNSLIKDLEDIAFNDPVEFNKLVSLRKDKNKEAKLNAQKANQRYCKKIFFINFTI